MGLSLGINYPSLREEDYEILRTTDLGKDFVDHYHGEPLAEQYRAFISNYEKVSGNALSRLSSYYRVHFFFAEKLGRELGTNDDLFLIINRKVSEDFFDYLRTSPQHLFESLNLYESFLRNNNAWHFNFTYYISPDLLEKDASDLEKQAALFGSWVSSDDRKLAYYRSLFFQRDMDYVDALVTSDMIQQVIFIGSFYSDYFHKKGVSSDKLRGFGFELVDSLLSKGDKYLDGDSKVFYNSLKDNWDFISRAVKSVNNN